MAIKYGKKYKKHFEDAKKKDSYWINQITLQFATALWNKMQANGIKPSELAKIIGTSPAYITKVLRGDANYTVETLYKLSKAVDCKIEINMVDKNTKQHEDWHVGNNIYTLNGMKNANSSYLTQASNNNTWSDPEPIELIAV